MNKRIITKDELKTLSNFSNDVITKHILDETFNILDTNVNQRIMKKAREQLINLGYTYKELTYGNAESHEYATKSLQLDIIDNNILRVGLGQEQPYTIRWLEIPVKF